MFNHKFVRQRKTIIRLITIPIAGNGHIGRPRWGSGHTPFNMGIIEPMDCIIPQIIAPIRAYLKFLKLTRKSTIQMTDKRCMNIGGLFFNT